MLHSGLLTAPAYLLCGSPTSDDGPGNVFSSINGTKLWPIQHGWEASACKPDRSPGVKDAGVRALQQRPGDIARYRWTGT